MNVPTHPFRRLLPHVGRDFTPPSTATRDLWMQWPFMQIEIHPRWWRFGISLRWPTMIGLLLGPLVIGFGKPVSKPVPGMTWTSGSAVPWQGTVTWSNEVTDV